MLDKRTLPNFTWLKRPEDVSMQAEIKVAYVLQFVVVINLFLIQQTPLSSCVYYEVLLSPGCNYKSVTKGKIIINFLGV